MDNPETVAAPTLNEEATVKQYTSEFVRMEASMGFMVAGGVYNASFLGASGMSPSQVGSFMSVYSLVAMFSPMIWGMISDKYRTMKKTTFITTLLAIIVYAPMPFYVRIQLTPTMTLAPVMILISATVNGPAGQLLTSWVMQARKEHPTINFGSIRLFWSLFYAVACFSYATIMSRIDGMNKYNVPFTGFGIAGLVTLFFIFRSHDFNAGGLKKQSFKEMPIGKVITHPRILIYLCFSVFITMPTLGLNNFMQYLLTDVNGDRSFLGYMVGIRSLLAVPFMFFSNNIHKKIGTRNALSIGAIAYLVAQILFSLCQNTFQILGVCVLQGLAFGLIVPTQVLYINQYAPISLIATTQTMITVANQLSHSLFSTVGGFVIEFFGIRMFYRMSALACIIAFSLFTFGNKMRDKKRGVD